LQSPEHGTNGLSTPVTVTDEPEIPAEVAEMVIDPAMLMKFSGK
jgi:hypothetical protein